MGEAERTLRPKLSLRKLGSISFLNLYLPFQLSAAEVLSSCSLSPRSPPLCCILFLACTKNSSEGSSSSPL